MKLLRFLKQPYRWAGLYALLLTGAFVFVLLDTFVIPRSYAAAVVPAAETASAEASGQRTAVMTDTAYQDDKITITIETLRQNNTTLYVADVRLSDASDLKTALASDTYGRNIKEKTSDMAEEQNAILAINGDYYGFRDSGYVLRNGTAYRSTARAAGDDEALVIDEAGNFSIIRESEVSLECLAEDGAWQVFSFGPALVENGKISVTADSEVDQSMRSNPRTAIGQIDALHYVFIVSDGRTSESEGLSLLELAQVLKDRGCTTAYNLDGGGSSTMVFNGEIVNHPAGGKGSSERKVSDIVYLGY